MKQLVLETRNINAVIGNGGGVIIKRVAVFAWVVGEEGAIQPLFIDNAFLMDEQPYGIERINQVSAEPVEIVGYEWNKMDAF
jgi:hypothetical protein